MHRGALKIWQQPSIDELVRRLDVIRRRMPELRFAPAASPAELAALEAAVGQPLPADVRALYAYANGSPGAVYYRYTLVAIARAIATTESMLHLAQIQFGPAYWHRTFIPVLDRGNADSMYIDVGGIHGAPGSVIDFNHEEPAVRQVRYASVTHWLEALVDGLECGLYAWADEAVFPRGFLDGGELDEARAHDRLRANDAYPWTRRLALDNRT